MYRIVSQVVPASIHEHNLNNVSAIQTAAP
jgi:hypothetical protein